MRKGVIQLLLTTASPPWCLLFQLFGEREVVDGINYVTHVFHYIL